MLWNSCETFVSPLAVTAALYCCFTHPLYCCFTEELLSRHLLLMPGALFSQFDFGCFQLVPAYIHVCVCVCVCVCVQVYIYTRV